MRLAPKCRSACTTDGLVAAVGTPCGFFDQFHHLFVPAGPFVKAAGGAAVGDGVNVGGGQVFGRRLNFAVHAVEGLVAANIVGDPQSLPMDGHVFVGDQLEVCLAGGIGRGNHHANALPDCHDNISKKKFGITLAGYSLRLKHS